MMFCRADILFKLYLEKTPRILLFGDVYVYVCCVGKRNKTIQNKVYATEFIIINYVKLLSYF